MELNTRGRYAVMAMADVAKNGIAATVSLPAVAERQHISLAYLEQLFALMRRAGIVESVRGRGGGYRLTRPAAEITIAEIMFAVGEPVEMTRCTALEFGGCVKNAKCLTHDLWRALSNHIIDFLEGVSLQDVIDGVATDRPTLATKPIPPLRELTVE